VAKRFIRHLHKTHPRQKFMICSDGLMSHQPMIETTFNERMHYLFFAKPGDYKYMTEWLNAYHALPTKEYTDDKGRMHIYTWQNRILLHGGENSIEVNCFQCQLKNELGKITYANSWFTDIEITENNVEKVTKVGRCRWKIENECFNTLKN
jgi:hypothetical protein